MDRVGEVHESANGFEWRINNFFQLSEDDRYFSPSFFFNGTSWSLGIDPNGDQGNHSLGYIDLRLVKKPGDFPISVEFSLALKHVNRESVLERHCKENFGEGCDRHISHRIIFRSELVRRKSELVPYDVLTVVCSLKILESTRSDSEVAVCSYCKGSFVAEIISSHEKICVEKPTKCLECSSVILLKNLYDHVCQISKTEGDNKTGKCFCCKEDLGTEFISLHESCFAKSIRCSDCSKVVPLQNCLENNECQNERIQATEKLLIDFKRIMLSGDYSDLTVKVKGENFRLHKSILVSRSAFFDSKIKHEVQEMIPDTISIDDCEPNHFRTLIQYIYTGTADNLCPENVCDLYEIALKYQVDQMKFECLQLLMNTISVDNFCIYTDLALKHDEDELFQKAIELFTCNIKEITGNVSWKTFLAKYPAEANELFKKDVNQYDRK